MRTIKTAIINLDPTVGALRSNADKAIAFARSAAEENCTVGVFSEQVISGYPAEDLVQWGQFVERQWKELLRFAKETEKAETIFILGLTVEYNSALYNCAAVVCKGRILGIVPKLKLPTYGVFYEQRVFSFGLEGMAGEVHGVPFGDIIFEFPFGIMAVEVCEDMWSSDGPMRRRAYSGAELIVNISASPWRTGIVDTRREIISTRGGDNLSTIVYANQVGGNDSLVFDGGGFINQNGRMVMEAHRWREGMETCFVDLDRTRNARTENTTWRGDQRAFLKSNSPVKKVLVKGCPQASLEPEAGAVFSEDNYFIPGGLGFDPREEYFRDIVEAMVAGLKGYFEKTNAFKKIGIALSGGKDSALTLLIVHIYATRKFSEYAEGERKEMIRNFVHTFSMPTQFNSEETRSIARRLAEDLGVSFVEVPIGQQFEAMRGLSEKMLAGNVSDLALENMQSRIRGSAMWNWSNTEGGMWIQTGNMSEKAVGYTTIGGDLMGSYSLIGNLPKTVVIELIEFLYRDEKSPYRNLPSLKLLIDTEASAELSENQEDEKELMPFDVLDACYALFVGEKMAPLEVYKVLAGRWGDGSGGTHKHTSAELKNWIIKFIKLFRASIFKWVQSPQTVHLGTLDLDRERALQLPVVQSDEWLLIKDLEDYNK